ncbi:MAG: HAD-IIIC family phosphatase [Catenulispora sp.]|nr:HAD-IIIC family phosphatase [Catenulispora sp.]
MEATNAPGAAVCATGTATGTATRTTTGAAAGTASSAANSPTTGAATGPATGTAPTAAAPSPTSAHPASAEPAPGGYEQLLALTTEGLLVERYPEVEHLLSGLSEAELLAAGQLLSRVDADAVAARHPQVPTVSLAVTGHGTLASLIPALAGQLARHGMTARTRPADYDSYVYDLSDPGSALYAARADLTLCVLDPEVVFDEVPVPWQVADVEQVFARKLRLLDTLAGTFTAVGRGSLVFNTIPLPRRYAAQLVDHASRAALGAVWREANARLLRLAETFPALVVLDLDPVLAAGVPVSEARTDAYAKAHLSPQLLAEYARQIGHLARNVAGRTKKCLAVDLDNTLWGGILGDDGLAGIEVAETYRGEAFRAFQRVVKQLGSQGVLLAALSKNDSAPVREVFRDHPAMTLREDDFVRISANWQPKHENLERLAEALNLDVGSFVFADDSAYECGLVRRELPRVGVVRLDEEPAYHIEKLLRDGWFDSLRLTEEDRLRAVRYADELERKDFLASFDSITDYLRELDIRVRLGTVDALEVPRVSQLTQRTNQFNMTTRRLQPADVQSLVDDPAALVLAIHSGDRFGENGLVGVILGRWRDGEHGEHGEHSTAGGEVLDLENFLLSCRVFSRGIEKACLAAVLRHAKERGAAAVYGSYRPTAKNGTVEDFYPRHGFVHCPDDAPPEPGTGTAAGTAACKYYRHDLAEIIAVPDHVHLTANL